MSDLIRVDQRVVKTWAKVQGLINNQDVSGAVFILYGGGSSCDGHIFNGVKITVEPMDITALAGSAKQAPIGANADSIGSGIKFIASCCAGNFIPRFVIGLGTLRRPSLGGMSFTSDYYLDPPGIIII